MHGSNTTTKQQWRQLIRCSMCKISSYYTVHRLTCLHVSKIGPFKTWKVVSSIIFITCFFGYLSSFLSLSHSFIFVPVYCRLTSFYQIISKRCIHSGSSTPLWSAIWIRVSLNLFLHIIAKWYFWKILNFPFCIKYLSEINLIFI